MTKKVDFQPDFQEIKIATDLWQILSGTDSKIFCHHLKLELLTNKSQQTQRICITFIQRRPNVFDVGPTLYKCYTNVLCLLGCPPSSDLNINICKYLCSNLTNIFSHLNLWVAVGENSNELP